MATKLVGPIQFQGKLGTIVGRATRKGNISVGMAPTKYTNPNTIAQRKARAKFLASQAFANGVPIECFAGLVPAARSGKMSVRNMAFKITNKNTDFTFQETSETIEATLNAQYFKFSKGQGAMYSSIELDADTPHKLIVTYNYTQDVDVNTTLIHAIVYVPDVKLFLHKTIILPQVGTSYEFDFDIPEQCNGLKAHAYFYEQHFDNTDAMTYFYDLGSATYGAATWANMAGNSTFSDTVYAGSTTLN